MESQLKELLKKALELKATDIHFKIERNEITVQFRLRQQIIDMPKEYCSLRLFRYLQYRANLDISNLSQPQTGQFEMEIEDEHYSLRFAILSSFNMVSGVLRILNADFDLKPEDLSLDKKQVQQLKKLLQRRSGLILITGPTGSGKTTTLYTLLNQVENRKIFTLEDPIEIYSRRYVQLQINEKQNFNYQEGIRQLLRHDPDIIVIGEIRDEIAAKMAVRCAMTGHLVISTLHSYSSMGAIERMLELGVDKGYLKDTLITVTNQRLYDLKKGKGKTGIYEIMPTQAIVQYFENGKSEEYIFLSESIEKAIQKGHITQKQSELDLT